MKSSPFLQMGLQFPKLVWILSLFSSSFLIHAQQPYIRKANTDCNNTDNSTSILGYTCNGQNSSCQSYLIFRSQAPYNSVSSISGLLASNPSQLSEINGVSVNAIFETDKLVIVPVNCSCSGEYYQANSSYVIEHEDTLFIIANNTFQGLSTCHALRNENIITGNLLSGTRITVPLRCACPTKNQTDEGVNSLLSYIIHFSDTVYNISQSFGVLLARTLQANELSMQDFTIYPFTTLLIPLQTPPNSQTILPSPPAPSVSPPTPSPPSSGKKKTWIYIVIGVVAAGVLSSVVSIIVFCVFFRKGKSKDESNYSTTNPIVHSGSYEQYEKTNGKPVDESEEFMESLCDIAQSLKVYKFGELKSATQNFSPKCLVKGSVYSGTINGGLVAIKKTNNDVAKEINLLNKINHFNIIKLSGVCFSQGYWYIVSDYAVNGSLTNWIYDSSGTRKVLSWSDRTQIALDVASGLNYLHCYTNPPHVHKDVKTSNIVLDSNFRAKITNFSLARSADGEGGEFALTRHIVGTKGYMAPEYLENGYVSPKLDVYSFGIVMLEIITGRENGVGSGARNSFLPEALKIILGGENPKEKIKYFVDPSLQGDYSLDQALHLAKLIEKCLKRDPAARPTMDDVMQTLSPMSNTDTSFNWEVSTDKSPKASSENSF